MNSPFALLDRRLAATLPPEHRQVVHVSRPLLQRVGWWVYLAYLVLQLTFVLSLPFLRIEEIVYSDDVGTVLGRGAWILLLLFLPLMRILGVLLFVRGRRARHPRFWMGVFVLCTAVLTFLAVSTFLGLPWNVPREPLLFRPLRLVEWLLVQTPGLWVLYSLGTTKRPD